MIKFICILLLVVFSGVEARQRDLQVNQSDSSTADNSIMQLLDTSMNLIYSDPPTSLDYANQVQKLAESNTSDSVKAWIYMKLGRIYSSHRALEEAEDVYLKAKQYYLEVPDMAHQAAQAYYSIGRVYKLMGRYGDALISLENSFSLAEELEDIYLQANIMRRTANISKHLDEFENALEFANSSIELSSKHGFNDILSGAHMEAGFILNRLEQYPQAIAELKLAISVSDSTDYNNLADASDGLGNVYRAQGEYDSALIFYLESMQIRSQVDDPESLHWNYINIGLVYQKMEVYPKAREYYQLSLGYAKERQNEVMEGNSLLRLGRLEEDMGNTAVGLDHMLKAEDLLNSNGALSLELLVLKSLQRHFEKKGDYKSSNEYMHQLVDLQQEIHSSQSENSIEDIRVMYRTKLVEDEIKLLEQESLIKDLEADHLKRRIALTLMLVGLLVVVAGSLVVLWRLKSRANQHIQERNRRLDEMNVELLALNKTKDRLFSIIGHDLKNPINTIMGFNDLLNSKHSELTHETRSKYLGYISESIKNVSELLEDLLEWSRTQRETISFKQQQLDLNELIRKNVELAQATAEKKNITLEAHNSGPVMVMADDYMVNTVLRNLISNAVKFTSEKGTIQIQTKAAAKTVDVSVNDTGIGMSDEVIGKLFQVDHPVSMKGTSGEPGTGLGLLICKEFVEKHNGTIHVTSKPGKGSTFSFDLPRATG